MEEIRMSVLEKKGNTNTKDLQSEDIRGQQEVSLRENGAS